MPPPRRIVLVAYAGAQGLDIFGPAEVFAAAARHAALEPGAAPARTTALVPSRSGSIPSHHPRRPGPRVAPTPLYRVVLAASGRARALATTSGVEVRTHPLATLRLTARDTVLVVGGEESAVRAAVGDRALLSFVRRAARTCERIGSVCSGAFVLAAAGLLDGRRAATHWSACARLARYRPAASVDADAIYVRDGNVWTSAGVTTGIDMSLAIVEADHGRALADAVAARLVLYARRPGFQSQWSAALVAQHDAGAPLAAAIDWLRGHLGGARGATGAIGVEAFARRAAMSVRTLHRVCADRLHLTPRRLIEKIRVEEARLLLHTTGLPPKAIAARCGFGNPTRMAAAFARTLGIAPRTVREIAN